MTALQQKVSHLEHQLQNRASVHSQIAPFGGVSARDLHPPSTDSINLKVSHHLDVSDLLGAISLLISDRHFSQLTPSTIRKLLSSILGALQQAKKWTSSELDMILGATRKCIGGCYQSIDSQDALFVEMIDLLMQLIQQESGLTYAQKRTVELIYEDISQKVE